MKHHALAIDGPAGAGKSTVAKMLANRLGYVYIDTGAMYRATTYKALRLKINLDNPEEYTFLHTTDMTFINNVLFMDGEDITQKIRTNVVNQNVSLVASHIPVRNELVRLQQKIAHENDVVMDGRDIGTVVLPDADLKVFLTANVEERAKRRYKEHLNKGQDPHIKQVIEDIVKRDQKDSTRKESPLRVAEDAIVLDTTYLTIEEVVNKIIELTDKKENKHGF
jgi:cytidylate kinase